MANILQNVQTYQMSGLAFLQNLNCFIATANTKFKNFDKLTANLGDTVTFDLPPRFVSNPGLVATFEGADQRVQSLTVNNAENVAYAFTAQQFIFNAEDYMQRFGQGAIVELSAQIEADVASTIIDHTYRFYGNGVNAINSYGQLATALANYRNYGSPKDQLKVYLSDIAVPDIVNSGLNQFVTKRNDESANSWMIGSYDNAEFYRSNLLPVQIAGNVGQNNTTLTLVSVSADGTQLTFSGAANNDASAFKKGDKIQFQDGVANQPNVRFLTFVGHKPSQQPVQCRVQADAASNGSGQVTINVFPALISTPGDRNQNLSTPLAAGMQIKALPSHREGLICGGNALFVAMPQLPTQEPFPTANAVDPDTGVSLRLTHGATFGQNQLGQIYDAIWGKTLVDEYSMSLIFPL